MVKQKKTIINLNELHENAFCRNSKWKISFLINYSPLVRSVEDSVWQDTQIPVSVVSEKGEVVSYETYWEIICWVRPLGSISSMLVFLRFTFSRFLRK